MAKKFKKVAGLGCQIAVEEMTGFTLWFQGKNDFFCTSSDFAPLFALETQTNLWKQLSIFQYLIQDPKSTKFELFGGIFSTWNDL